MEVWKPVVGYEGQYEVSDCGGVRSVDRVGWNGKVHHKINGQMMMQHETHRGHFRVDLYKDSKRKCLKVHRLMLEAFVGPCPNGLECRHLNGNPQDNRVENLAWGTHAENRADMITHGRSTKGEDNPNSKLSDNDVKFIRIWLDSGYARRQIAEAFQISTSLISFIASGKIWSHV